jgi:curved DNA-binding protein CbpA
VEDFYAALQVRPTASAAEIERAYRRLARANHPDLLRAASPESRQRGEEVLKRINRAHRVLGDRERRADYDRQRQGRAAGPARPSDPTRPPTVPPRQHAERTVHWGGGGPIDIEWETPPIRAQRRETELFSLARLLRYAAVIIMFAVLLAVVWRPGLGPRPSPTPVATPTAVVTPIALPTVALP